MSRFRFIPIRDASNRIVITFSVVCLFATTLLLPSTTAEAVDQLTWYNSADRMFVDGQSLTGFKRVIVLSSTKYSGRYVKKWCVYLDSQPLDGPSYSADFPTPDPGATRPAWIYYEQGQVSRPAPDQTSPGCWTTEATDRSYGIDLTVNSTTWANGSHVFKIEATASDDTIFSKSVNVSSQNLTPTVEWVSQTPIQVSDSTSVAARITPNGVRIVSACIKKDGSPILATFSGSTFYDGSWNGPMGSFLSESGCTAFTGIQGSSWPSGLHQITTLNISIPTNSWAQIPNSISIETTDSTGRTFNSTANFEPIFPKPLLRIDESANVVWREKDALRLAYTSSGVNPRSICAYVNNEQNDVVGIKGCINVASVAEIGSYLKTIDTTRLKNGKYSLQLVTTDRFGRSSTSSIDFNVDNQPPTLSPTGVTENQVMTGTIAIAPNASIPSVMKTTTLVSACTTGITTTPTCDNSPHTVNTNCYPNGNEIITMSATDSIGGSTTEIYKVHISNPGPKPGSLSVSSDQPTWRDKSISGRLRFTQTHGCRFRVRFSGASGASKSYSGDLMKSATAVDFNGLSPKTRYTATVSVVSASGTRTKSISFTTPGIPSPPKPQPKIPRFVGMNLQDAWLWAGPLGFTYKQAPGCERWGIYIKRHWIVVKQVGFTLYACKFTN